MSSGRSISPRRFSPGEFHPARTCAMVQLEPGGAVDDELRVYGLGRSAGGGCEHHADAAGGANTCQMVYAVAEKGAQPADLIRYEPPKVVESQM
ncbi:hypothetical protein VTK56DRAFT_5788 [Thermocarpiscus australiensis]